MMPDYFDIHSHLNFPEYDKDREALILELKNKNTFTITVGTELKTSEEAVALADKHEHLFATVGLHPTHDLTEGFDEKVFEALVSHAKTVAVGECGLDYARLEGDSDAVKARQKEEFEKQIEFAIKHNKPLMIHCRDAYPDCLEILSSKKKEYGEKLRGDFHFFTSPVEIAKKCLEIGFFLSFTGPITFAKQYEELVKFVPLESMMTETDAPFAAPAPYRGKRNEPAYVVEIVKKIAEIKGESVDKVQRQVVKNAFDLFLTENS